MAHDLDLEPLLGTWRVLPAYLLELRSVHACALNNAVARRCASDRVDAAELVARAARSSWTKPELAFAHYVTLAAPDAPDQAVDAALAALSDVCDHDCPAPELRACAAPREWVRYGLRTLVGDYRRDGREISLRTARAHDADVEACAAALELLEARWSEMALAIDALVREVVWYETAYGPRSGTLTQAYGAVFLARGRRLATALEDLVHEATHLEVVARLALEPTLRNPLDRDVSPYRQRPRPLTRVLHVAMVATRGVEAFDRCLDALPAGERDLGAAIRDRFAESRSAALASLRRSARWTRVGECLWDDLNAMPASA